MAAIRRFTDPSRTSTLLDRVRLRPLGLAATLLLLGGGVLPWANLVTVAVIRGLAFPVFGAQASLWDLASYSSPVSLYHAAPLAAGLLLIASSGLAWIRGRLAAVLATLALLIFIGGTWGLYGTHALGTAFTIVAPASGMFWALAGASASALSYRYPARTLRRLTAGLLDTAALASMGLFLAAGFITIDAADHAAGGNLLAFLGDGPVEPWLHVAFVGPVAALTALRLTRLAEPRRRAPSSLVALAAMGLMADAVYHVSTGDAGGLIGHTPAEALAHVASYYGIALMSVSRFVLRPRVKETGTRMALRSA